MKDRQGRRVQLVGSRVLFARPNTMLPRAARLAAQLNTAGGQQSAKFSTAVVAAATARRLALVVPTLGLGTFAAVTDEPLQVAYGAAMIPVRLGRDVVAATTMLGDYIFSLRGLQAEEREAAKRECHQRGANKLLEVCFKNGGIYIKLGQHLGMLDHLLPSEYVVTMRDNMLDKCPVSTYEQVRQTIIEDLGSPPEQLYKSFSQQPIASASLAQVHKAVDHDGRQLAIKVQHRGLRETSTLDLATIDFLVNAVKWLAPDFDYQWLVEESKENLPLELDFLHEAANSARCAGNLASRASRVRGRVAAPAVDLARTSHRVLTMEFVEGVKVTDREGLAALGAAPAEVAALMAKCFNEMIFTFGDVHCDPHAANLLVRATPLPAASTHTSPSSNWKGGDGGAAPRGRWQLVLLDHGLYRQLDDSFRLDYAGLWHSLVFADEAGIRKFSTAMNAGDMVPLFAGMLTQRPWEEITKKQVWGCFCEWPGRIVCAGVRVAGRGSIAGTGSTLSNVATSPSTCGLPFPCPCLSLPLPLDMCLPSLAPAPCHTAPLPHGPQSSDRLRLKYTEDERAEIQDFASQYAREIGDLLRKMPRPDRKSVV